MKRLKNIILILVLLPLALMTGCAGGRAAGGSASEHGPTRAETSVATGTGLAAETLQEPVEKAAQGPVEGTLPESADKTALEPVEKTGSETAAATDTVIYRDGTYKAQTQPDYEGYFTKAEVTVKDGKIVSVDWSIYDANRDDKPFDEKYEEVFAGNDYYTEQSRSDWKGSRTYGPKLIETQDPDGVDAVSGATWTSKKFREIVKVALEEAEK